MESDTKEIDGKHILYSLVDECDRFFVGFVSQKVVEKWVDFSKILNMTKNLISIRKFFI